MEPSGSVDRPIVAALTTLELNAVSDDAAATMPEPTLNPTKVHKPDVFRYATWRIDDRAARGRRCLELAHLLKLFKIDTSATIHINDGAAAFTVRAKPAEGEWLTVLTHPTKYPPELLKSKRFNGHARVLVMDKYDTPATVADSMPWPATCLFANGTDALTLVDRLIPTALKSGGAVVLCLPDPRANDVADRVTKWAADHHFDRVVLCRHNLSLEPWVFVVLLGYNSVHTSIHHRSPTVHQWRGAVVRLESERSTVVRAVTDLYNYFVIGQNLETSEDCRQHNALRSQGGGSGIQHNAHRSQGRHGDSGRA